jgi:AAA ATPase domain
VLRRSLERAGAGHGQVVAIVGEVGVGKSRLHWEFTRSHHADGWLVLRSRSVSYARLPSLCSEDHAQGGDHGCVFCARRQSRSAARSIRAPHVHVIHAIALDGGVELPAAAMLLEEGV